MKKIAPGLFLSVVFPLLGHAEGLLAVDNPARNGQERGVYASLEAFEGNDQVAMRQYGGGWQGDYTPRNGTNLGLLAARAETGVQWQGYRLGALYRAVALVEASRDASDLVRQYKQSNGYDLGRTYQLDYRLKGFEADGAHLSMGAGIEFTGDVVECAQEDASGFCVNDRCAEGARAGCAVGAGGKRRQGKHSLEVGRGGRRSDRRSCSI